jgi:putative ABC transport system permease protein
MSTATAPARSRLAPGDLPSLATFGLRTRRLRTTLSALGVAIGIAAMVAVLGISDSNRADLLGQLDELGTNMLQVAPGQTFLGKDSKLPKGAPAMLGRVDGVQDVAALVKVSGTVLRNDKLSDFEGNAIAIYGAGPELAPTAALRLRAGRFLDAATAKLPTVVLGAVAAQRLGIDHVGGRVWIGGRWFGVIGILEPAPLAAQLDAAVLIGQPAAEALLGAGHNAATVFVRANPDRVNETRPLLAPTANPQHPEEVQVSRPSDALEARAAAQSAYTSLFLGLGAVALLVGGVGIANVLVISVLERRSEIGLRRALGARRRHIAQQFFAEALTLSALGGLAGVALGAAVTAGYATAQGWSVVVPAAAIGGGVGASLAVGAVAGLYPALRASRLAPTEALRTV